MVTKLQERKMLKFANIAKVGQGIRAYDFKPMAGREDCYVEGKVISVGNVGVGYSAYEIICGRDVYDGVRQQEGEKGSRVGQIVYVPFEVSFMEYDARIINLSE